MHAHGLLVEEEAELLELKLVIEKKIKMSEGDVK
jgi:hypothetical protein